MRKSSIAGAKGLIDKTEEWERRQDAKPRPEPRPPIGFVDEHAELRDAVVEAAKEVIADQPDAMDRPSSWGKLALLEAAVKDLLAAQGPQPVDPQTLAPSTKFNFIGKTGQRVDSVFTVIELDDDGGKRWVGASGIAMRFAHDDRVIPLAD